MMTDTELLARLGERLFLTDGGIETVLIFEEGIDLPDFAAFTLLEGEEGRQILGRYFERFIGIAQEARAGFLLESPTWRASADWGRRLGYSPQELARINRYAIALMRELQARHETRETPMLVSGCIGPRGDGYVPGEVMSPIEAEAYHDAQVAAFVEAGADLVTAITMTNESEAAGIARAAARRGVASVISFTVETDGRLPTGQSLREAIEGVDEASGGAPAYFMVNCAHPTHFAPVLADSEAWTRRIGGLRANASRCSHAELNEALELDRGDPDDLAARYGALCARFPSVRVLGGCCGTDHAHVAAIARACLPASAPT